MTDRPIRTSSRHSDVLTTAVDLATEVTNQLIADEAEHFVRVLLKEMGDGAPFRGVVDDSTALRTHAIEVAAELGFCLGVTLASHAARGNGAWLAEALRVSHRRIAVKDRSEESTSPGS
jgi:hypothetical protein